MFRSAGACERPAAKVHVRGNAARSSPPQYSRQLGRETVRCRALGKVTLLDRLIDVKPCKQGRNATRREGVRPDARLAASGLEPETCGL